MILPLFGLPGGPELLVILLIVVLLFGANKLPSLARSMGQASGEFQKGRENVENEIRRGFEEGRETAEADADTDVEGAENDHESGESEGSESETDEGEEVAPAERA
jgi:sec-independent protein translocase protein TatA